MNIIYVLSNIIKPKTKYLNNTLILNSCNFFIFQDTVLLPLYVVPIVVKVSLNTKASIYIHWPIRPHLHLRHNKVYQVIRRSKHRLCHILHHTITVLTIPYTIITSCTTTQPQQYHLHRHRSLKLTIIRPKFVATIIIATLRASEPPPIPLQTKLKIL